MSLQHTHRSTPFSERKQEITIVCDGLNSPANIGALFRLGEAFGVKEIVFCNATIDISSNRLKRTARNTIDRVPYRTSEDILQEINSLKALDLTVIALEITDKSVPLNTFNAKIDNGLVLIIGNEQHGVSESVLALNQAVHIDMYGHNSSMNVVQAAAIALYALSQ